MTELCRDAKAEQGDWGLSVVRLGLHAFLETALWVDASFPVTYSEGQMALLAFLHSLSIICTAVSPNKFLAQLLR